VHNIEYNVLHNISRKNRKGGYIITGRHTPCFPHNKTFCLEQSSTCSLLILLNLSFVTIFRAKSLLFGEEALMLGLKIYIAALA